MSEAANADKATVASFWDALYDRDWPRIAGCFGPRSTYTDVPSPANDIAVGPDQIVARLRLGIEPIERYEHQVGLVVGEVGVVVTEHAETWHWHSGESVTLPFVSVQEVADGMITRWSDYWDLQTLLGAAPEWWLTQIMGGWKHAFETG